MRLGQLIIIATSYPHKRFIYLILYSFVYLYIYIDILIEEN